ncbi:hypothetical protein SELMODRAFT_410848 [Selaginella moellendorffii]|uniref:Uncharacterized protein n=1 Tax=Selaginella moellendorffii TaxID=88036 RepID=D8RG23_SELML|nr:hypothetical protein SELMODRAFT_410848 [Selaginella moellendorffii]
MDYKFTGSLVLEQAPQERDITNIIDSIQPKVEIKCICSTVISVIVGMSSKSLINSSSSVSPLELVKLPVEFAVSVHRQDFSTSRASHEVLAAAPHPDQVHCSFFVQSDQARRSSLKNCRLVTISRETEK